MEEYGDRVDGRIAAWGMAFEDGAEVVGTLTGTHLGVRSPESALRWFRRGGRVRARLVWL